MANNIRPYNLGNILSQGENILNARYARDPESLPNQLLAAKLNEYENPTAASAKFGTVNPRDFKAPSLQVFAGSGDFNDLERYERLRETTVNGIPGLIDVVTKEFFPSSTLQSEAQGKKTLSGAAEAGKLGEQLKTKPKIEAAISKSKFEQGKLNVKPKMIGAADAAQDRTQNLKELIAQAKTQATGMTVGFAGNMTKGIAGTPAHDLSQTLLTLQANAGFDRLQEMRNNSVTGGALGQVSERELGLLMAAYAALEQSQSKGQFLQNLGRFEKQVDQSWKRVKLAYRLDYGEDYKELEEDPPSETQEVPVDLNAMSLDELKAYREQLIQ